MAITEIDVGLVYEVGVPYRDNLVELTFGNVGAIDFP